MRPRPPGPVRVAHLTTVDMSLALLLGPELQADVAAGLDTYGLSAPGSYVREVQTRGVTHVPISSFTRSWDVRRDLAAARELLAVLRWLEPDVLHTHTPKAGVLGRVLGRVCGVPVIVNTCHGLWATAEDRLAKRLAVYAAETLAAWCSDMELYQNDADRQTLRRVVPQRRARTVGNGVDLERFRPDAAGRARVRSELGVADDEVLIGGVGRRVAEKGLAELGEAARALAGRARVVWVGPDDPDKPDWVREAEAGIELVGARSDMPAVYSALDVFCLPSWREGFSRSAMEAAACGCALVLTDVRGCREVVDHDIHGLLVPPRDPAALTDALTRLVDDADRRRELADAARRRALVSFDQGRVARDSIAAYRDVAARRAR